MTSGAPSSTIRLIVADDHPMIREGLLAVLATEPDMRVVGEAADGRQALEAYRAFRPDVALVDLQMPGMGGIEAILAIRAEFPGARLVVLTTFAGDVQALRAMKAGAAGYLLKTAGRDQLVEAIRTVHGGRLHLPAELAYDISIHAIREPMSEREIEVLRLVAAGRSNKDVALALGVSDETIKAHLKSIFSKLEVSDRTAAVTVAARRGILDLSPGSPSPDAR